MLLLRKAAKDQCKNDITGPGQRNVRDKANRRESDSRRVKDSKVKAGVRSEGRISHCERKQV